jgi:hypothetical protein
MKKYNSYCRCKAVQNLKNGSSRQSFYCNLPYILKPYKYTGIRHYYKRLESIKDFQISIYIAIYMVYGIFLIEGQIKILKVTYRLSITSMALIRKINFTNNISLSMLPNA